MNCNPLMKEALDNLKSYTDGILDTKLPKSLEEPSEHSKLYRYQIEGFSGNSNKDILKLKPGNTITLDTPLSTSTDKQAYRDFKEYKDTSIEDLFDDKVPTKGIIFTNAKGKRIIDINKKLPNNLYSMEKEAILPKGTKMVRLKDRHSFAVFKLLSLGGILMYIPNRANSKVN